MKNLKLKFEESGGHRKRKENKVQVYRGACRLLNHISAVRIIVVGLRKIWGHNDTILVIKYTIAP